MTKRQLTAGQAADMLGVSPSTLRAWCTSFELHLSESARGDGKRHRSFSSDDLATLARAKDLLHTGKSPVEVSQLLGVTDSAPSAALVVLPEMALVLQQHQARVLALESEVIRLRGEVVRLGERHSRQRDRQAAEVAELRAQVEALMLVATARRSWWARLRGK